MTNTNNFDRVGWAKLKEVFKQSYGEYPSVISLLFLIGLEHVPSAESSLTKEEKQEVIHVGLCTLLQKEGLYAFDYLDDDGWPHFQSTELAKELDIEKQENYLKQLLIDYFL